MSLSFRCDYLYITMIIAINTREYPFTEQNLKNLVGQICIAFFWSAKGKFYAQIKIGQIASGFGQKRSGETVRIRRNDLFTFFS